MTTPTGRLFLRRRLPPPDETAVAVNYKPVVLIHGLFDPTFSLDLLADVIRVYHPGTQVTSIKLYNSCKSLVSLWEQIDAFREEVEKIAEQSPNGIHLIGVSQGTMVARGVLQTSSKHNVDTFISIGGPLMGQFGLSFLAWLPGYKWVVNKAYKVFYSRKGQKFSVPEFWKDPHQIDLYLSENKFLPLLNNEVDHPRKEEFKKNFTQIKHMVLIGGPNDDTITPWQSSHFGFYDEKENIVPMEEQEVYKKDSFGLLTLDERKAITMYTVQHVFHMFYCFDVPFIKEYVLPHLD